MFILKSTDISFSSRNFEESTVTFEINNEAAVKRFMENKELQQFLTDPVFGLDHKDNGCRLNIKVDYDEKTLTIGRKGQSPLLEVLYCDLLASIVKYILPVTDYNRGELYDMEGGLSSRHADFIDRVVAKDHSVGKAFNGILERGKKFAIDHEEANWKEGFINRLKSDQLVPQLDPALNKIIFDYLDVSETPTKDGSTEVSAVSEVSDDNTKKKSLKN